MIVCEPDANMVFFSPRQLKRDGEIFERFVLTPNRELRDLLAAHDVDLIFHNCGELTTDMVRMFSDELRPHVMSLGSSRKLWEDAAVVADDIVLYGNLPTKTFYSDEAMPEEEVRRLSRELVHNMGACGHAHILGSECDVLHVPEAAETIRRKVAVMLEA
jgi:uroporphyrinogen-III decarboxylase